MTNADPEGQIFLSHPHTNDGFFFLLTIQFCNFKEINSIFEIFWKGFTLTLQETRSIHDSMNRPKTEFITYIYIF